MNALKIFLKLSAMAWISTSVSFLEEKPGILEQFCHDPFYPVCSIMLICLIHAVN